MGQNKVQKRLQKRLNKAVKQSEAGVTACIITPDACWELAAGVADRQSQRAMRPRDRFRIASISKVFVATVVLQLYEAGRLGLDDTLSHWLPEVIHSRLPHSSKISVRHLLNHTSGLDDYLATEGFERAVARRGVDRPWRAHEAIRYLYDLEPLDRPGKSHSYSNSNYILLELIVEAVTGQGLHEILRQHLLDPLGLQDTFTELRESLPGGFVEGYEDLDEDGEQDETRQYNAGLGLGDGGLISTAYDVARFAHTLFTTNELLDPATFEEMTDWIDDGEEGWYGLGLCGWEDETWGEGWGHSGAMEGFLSTLWHLTEYEATLVVLSNEADDSDPDGLAEQLLEIALEEAE